MATPAPKRLSLVERQQQLLEKQGFSKPQGKSEDAATRIPSKNSRVQDFYKRQEAHAAKTGRGNASSDSRVALPMEFDVDGGEGGDTVDADDGASAARSVASHAPSMHPSLAGSVVSKACSEVTIGAGDSTGYWDFQHRLATAADLGHTCRECKLPFAKVGEAMTERRGARISTRYHAECFSGFADPRSQAGSSHHVGHLAGTQFAAAPSLKAGSKMRVGKHFDGHSDRRETTSMGGKISAFMGGGGFGSKSSKGQARVAQRAPGGFTEAELAEHNELMQAIPEESVPGEQDEGAE